MRVMVRITGALAVLLLTAGIAFAAGQKEAASSAPKQVSISWWALAQGGGGPDPREALRKQIVADYQKTHPNVNINLVMFENEAFKQKVQVAVQAGNPPDIFHSWGGGVMVAYAKAGMLRDITSYVQQNIAQKIGKGPLSVYGYDGHYYGAPYDMGGVGMWYNKAAFQKAGVTVPETWDQLLSAIPKLKSAGYIPIALGAGDKWPAHFWWTYLAMRLGGEPAFNAAYSGSGSFADPTYVKAGQLLLQLKNLDPFQTGYLGATYDDEAALMGNGKAAMELMGQWAPGVEASDSADKKGIGDDLGWFSFPSVAGGVGKNTDVMGGGNGYVIGKNAPDEALDFLNFFLSPEYDAQLVKVEGIVPVVKGAESAVKGNANLEKIVSAVANAGYFQLYYDQFLPPAVGEAVKDAVVTLLAGKADPTQAAQMVQAAWKKEQGK